MSIKDIIDTVICGDCLEVMRGMDDNSVDLVLTDPPYVGLKGGAIRNGKGVAKSTSTSIAIGDEWAANYKWVPEAWRIAKLGVVSFCSYHFVAELAMRFPAESRVCLLTWNKLSSPVPMNNVPWFSSEFIWGFKKSPGLKWRNWKSTVFSIANLTCGCVSTGERLTKPDGTALHPTQKPLKLMRELLSITDETMSVLDPFAGIGSTLVACADLKRHFIGIEINPDYCKIAEKRIQEERDKYALFGEQ